MESVSADMVRILPCRDAHVPWLAKASASRAAVPRRC